MSFLCQVLVYIILVPLSRVPSCRIIAPTPLHNGCFAFPIFSGFRDRSGIGIETGVYKALTGETGNGQ